MPLALPRVGLGCSALAGLYSEVDEVTALATIEAAYEWGIRYFDTAPLYGLGLSEERLGQVLPALPREELIVSTKVGRLLGGEPSVRFDFSSAAALESLAESRRRLRLERIDIVYIHDPDDHFEAAQKGAYSALTELRRRGELGAVGVGSNGIDVQLRFLEGAEPDCLLLAGRYTLLDHGRALREHLPLCLRRGVTVVCGGIFNSGVLADPDADPHYDYSPAPPEIVARARRLRDVCRAHGVPLRAAALQFPLGHPAVSTVLAGCRSRGELRDCLDALEVPIPPGLWAELRSEGLLDPAAPLP